MEFDVEKIKEYYGELVARRNEAVELALANKDERVAERFESAKAEIEKAVIEEIVAEAEAPYKHDIELCEKFIVVPVEDEELNEVVGEE